MCFFIKQSDQYPDKDVCFLYSSVCVCVCVCVFVWHRMLLHNVCDTLETMKYDLFQQEQAQKCFCMCVEERERDRGERNSQIDRLLHANKAHFP